MQLKLDPQNPAWKLSPGVAYETLSFYLVFYIEEDRDLQKAITLPHREGLAEGEK